MRLQLVILPCFYQNINKLDKDTLTVSLVVPNIASVFCALYTMHYYTFKKIQTGFFIFLLKIEKVVWKN